MKNIFPKLFSFSREEQAVLKKYCYISPDEYVFYICNDSYVAHLSEEPMTLEEIQELLVSFVEADEFLKIIQLDENPIEYASEYVRLYKDGRSQMFEQNSFIHDVSDFETETNEWRRLFLWEDGDYDDIADLEDADEAEEMRAIADWYEERLPLSSDPDYGYELEHEPWNWTDYPSCGLRVYGKYSKYTELDARDYEESVWYYETYVLGYDQDEYWW